MSYHLTTVEYRCFPDERVVQASLVDAGVPLLTLQTAFQEFVCPEPLVAGSGYQQAIAEHLQRHLARALERDRVVQLVSKRVSPRLNEVADLAFAKQADSRRVIVEIEFRPNVEKDLVKFQIAANSGFLSTAVLVVASSRAHINPSYTTMPEFAKTVRLIAELAPSYPLVVFGISGEHRDAEAEV